MIKNVYWSSCYSCQTLMKLNFLERYLKSTQIPNYMKIHPVGVKLFHVGKQTRKS